MSRLGAIASKQSQVLADKKILIDKVDELKKEYSDLEDKKYLVQNIGADIK